jgi:hypothetical protein
VPRRANVLHDAHINHSEGLLVRESTRASQFSPANDNLEILHSISPIAVVSAAVGTTTAYRALAAGAFTRLRS